MKENTKRALGELAFVITLIGILTGGIGYLTSNIGRTPKTGEVWEVPLEHSPWDKS
jgi:hypothetical protein